MSLFLIIASAVVVIALIALGNEWYKKKRREKFTQLADNLGVDIHFDLPSEDWDRIERFDFYKSKGTKHTVDLALAAQTDSTRITVCEYKILVNSGKNASKTTSTVLLVWDPRLDSPEFRLMRKTWNASFSAAVSKWFGFEFIQFPEDPAFDARYLVRGRPEEAVREYLNADRREGLMRLEVPAFEASGDCMIVIHSNRWLQSSEVQARFKEALAVLNAILEPIKN